MDFYSLAIEKPFLIKKLDFKNNFYLAEQMKLGSSDAYEFLMDSYYQKLCAYAFTLTHNHASSEDIVQNVFVEIWANKKNINPAFSIKNYLYKSVYNEFIDQYRKAKPVHYLEKKYLDAVDLAVDYTQDNLDELIRLIDKEIDNLPTKCKEIFLLNKKEGLTHIEISEYLNISVKTIEGHMARAFKILREKLDVKIQPLLFLLFGIKPNKAE